MESTEPMKKEEYDNLKHGDELICVREAKTAMEVPFFTLGNTYVYQERYVDGVEDNLGKN